jgi:hypothetical protein
MANNVTCRILLIGNESINQLNDQIKQRISDDILINTDFDDIYRVGRIFYGRSNEDEPLGYDEVGAKWIYDDQGYGGLGFVSGWDPVYKFQDYLALHASKLDPKVIVLMEYEDESPEFVGARYALMNSGNVVGYESKTDLSDILVTDQSSLDDEMNENNETGNYREIILWEDLTSKIDECKDAAFKAMKKENPWIPVDYKKIST